MPDIWAVGSFWPSRTSALVTLKVGTIGKRQNGSFMAVSHTRVASKRNRPFGLLKRHRPGEVGHSRQRLLPDFGFDQVGKLDGGLMAGGG